MTQPGPTEPAFALSGPAETLIADSVVAGFSDVAAADRQLKSGRVPIVLGALPFDPDRAAALMVPQGVRRTRTLPDWPTGPLPRVHVATAEPAPSEHRDRISRVLEELGRHDGRNGALQKVVLARGLRLVADGPLDARIVLRRLAAADPTGYGYLVDLTAAGDRHRGAALVGVSPELLVARTGDQVSCRPFAGSAPRSDDPAVDAANGAALVESGKNRREHQLVVDQLRTVLEPLCAQLDVAPEPELSATAAVWHLSTRITGRLRETSTTALNLASALHPTAAVGGFPSRPAVELIRELEGNRGFYAGAVGWCNAAGDGRWVVSLRCAQLSADRRHAVAHAGGGIVAGSDPEDELAETTAKFTTILSALAVAQ
ncbi:MAG TPA: isochorismate synthase [Mycobacterium sp.]|nr:isochorismate synthase [Mycobacterium sp.]